MALGLIYFENCRIIDFLKIHIFTMQVFYSYFSIDGDLGILMSCIFLFDLYLNHVQIVTDIVNMYLSNQEI